MRRLLVFTAIALCIASSDIRANQQTPATLDIYFLDMVGGGSTLIVTPLRESVLIDTGSLEPKHRDADRIYRACRHAGLEHIDYLITTHFHSDHFGGILELTERIPVKCFMDKGALPPAHEQNSKRFKQLYPLYQQATGGSVKCIRAGDDIPLRNYPTAKFPEIKLHCVASEKQVEGFAGNIDAPVEGFTMNKPDNSDNGRSIALVLTYGKFKFFAGGDITWNIEHHLAHPVNHIGKVDLYQVTHHGLDQSNNPLLLKAMSPTVCVAMNGPRKGIGPRTFGALKALPSVKAIYQIHYNTRYGDKGNTSSDLIANKEDPQKGVLVRASVDPKKNIFTVSIDVAGPRREFSIQ